MSCSPLPVRKTFVWSLLCVVITAGILAQLQAGVCPAWMLLRMKSKFVSWSSTCHKQSARTLQTKSPSLKMLHCWTDRLQSTALVLPLKMLHCWRDKHQTVTQTASQEAHKRLPLCGFGNLGLLGLLAGSEGSTKDPHTSSPVKTNRPNWIQLSLQCSSTLCRQLQPSTLSCMNSTATIACIYTATPGNCFPDTCTATCWVTWCILVAHNSIPMPGICSSLILLIIYFMFLACYMTAA